MSDTVDIGAARVRLIVDADSFEEAVAAGKIAIRGFASDAQAAYDRTEKATRRAADALLDYTHALGSADSTMTKLITRASNLGVEKTLIDAAVRSWQTHNDKLEAAAAAQAGYNELVRQGAADEKAAMAAANAVAQARFQNLQEARAAQSQQAINNLVAPGLAINTDASSHRLAAEEVFASIIAQENALLEAQAELAKTAANDQAEHVRAVSAAYKELLNTQDAEEQRLRSIANLQAEQRIQNLQDARAAQSQQAFNNLVAPGLSVNTQSNNQRADAEAAFASIVEAENEKLSKQEELVNLIAQARQASNAENAQQNFNRLLGIPQEEEKLALIQRRKDAEAAYLPILEQEARLEQENSQLAAKQQAFVQQLENTATTAGKTYYEMLQLRAAELGLGEAYQPLINKIRQQNESMGAGTLSAKQYQFALRGLPAQFTDIVVSLQGGQRPLTVLLQQGGQIKDMFGGVGSAVRVVGQEVVKIATNPLFILAGVAALVATAFAEASSRTTDFAIAASKGNLVAGNAKGLSTLAEQLSKLNNISIGHADEAVQSLAAAGKLTGDNFRLAAEASARWATVTGQSVDDITSKFNSLANDPMQAVLDGTLKVTEAQYDQLEAFERTGQKVKETQLAVKLYSDQINTDSAAVLANLSAGARGWIELKDAITNAWHELTGFVTEAAGSSFNVISKKGILASLANPAGTMAQIAGLRGEPSAPSDGAVAGMTSDQAAQRNAAMSAAAFSQGTKLTTDQVNANKELQKSIDDLGTKQQKFNAALVLENGLLSRSSEGFLKLNGIVKSTAGTFSGPGYDKLVNGLRLKIFGQNEGGDPTKPIKEWEKTALDSLKNVGQAQEYLYQQGSTDTKTYYAIQEGLAKGEEIIQLQSIDAQIKALTGRANSESQIAALIQQRSTVEQTYASTKAKLDHEELLAIQAKVNAYHDYVQGLADANIQLSRQGDQAAAAVGQGSRQQGLSQAISNAKNQADLRDRAAQDAVDALGAGDHTAAQAEADKKIAANAAALSTQLTILKGNYSELTAAQSDWSNGATKAWQNWSDQVSNVAAQTDTLFTGMFNDLTNDLLNFVKTGHLSLQSFLDDAVTQIEKSGLQYALQQALKYLNTANNSGSGDGSSSGTYGTNYGGLLTSIGSLLFSAKGNVFPAGTGLSSYRNSVVSSATVFPFAKGGVPNVGVMGEKGSEAIMPLTRTSGGELGVKMQGAAPSKVTNVNQTIVVPGANTRQTQDQTAIKVFGAAQRAARRS
jgi:lambda family phage tail tape measure protein